VLSGQSTLIVIYNGISICSDDIYIVDIYGHLQKMSLKAQKSPRTKKPAMKRVLGNDPEVKMVA